MRAACDVVLTYALQRPSITVSAHHMQMLDVVGHRVGSHTTKENKATRLSVHCVCVFANAITM